MVRGWARGDHGPTTALPSGLTLDPQDPLQLVGQHPERAPATVGVQREDVDAEAGDRAPGFDLAAAPRGSGPTTMADRMAAVDGTLTIDSARGCGTRVVARAPLIASSGT